MATSQTQRENDMAASDVHPTSQQMQMSLQAILRQLATSGIANNYHSLADALNELDMWDFVFNQASVTAHLHAFSARDNAIIHQLTHEGAYV